MTLIRCILGGLALIGLTALSALGAAVLVYLLSLAVL